MRYIPKPGQTAPQMPPRGPRGPIKNPGGVRAAANPKTPRDIGFGNRPLNTTGTPVGRPKAVNTGPRTPPPSANVNPIRPRGVMGTKPLNAQGVTAATPSRPKGGIGMTGGPKPSPLGMTGGPKPSPAQQTRPGMPGGPKPATGLMTPNTPRMKKGGMIKSSASKRGDGTATKGKTKGTMVKMAKGGRYI